MSRTNSQTAWFIATHPRYVYRLLGWHFLCRNLVPADRGIADPLWATAQRWIDRAAIDNEMNALHGQPIPLARICLHLLWPRMFRNWPPGTPDIVLRSAIEVRR